MSYILWVVALLGACDATSSFVEVLLKKAEIAFLMLDK